MNREGMHTKHLPIVFSAIDHANGIFYLGDSIDYKIINFK